MARLVSGSALGRDPEARDESRYRLAGLVARRLGGYRLYPKARSWYRDRAFGEMIDACPASPGTIKDKQYALYQLARAAQAVPGDTVECGVWRGAGSYLILKATEQTPERQHHVFDSFEGLSAPVEADAPGDPRAHAWSAGELAEPLDLVRRNLAGFESRVRFYPGWIPDRFDEVRDIRVAFCHIDVDLYEPTLQSLQFFYDRVVPGGLLVCDDYGYVDCPGATRAFDEFMADKPESIVHLPSGHGVVFKVAAAPAAGDGQGGLARPAAVSI